MFIDRHLSSTLTELTKSKVGRGVILTGARQTGKTTLLKHQFTPGYDYYSFDEAFSRQQLMGTRAADWIGRGRNLIFDEVQKAPDFLGTVKTILDDEARIRVILSGSAQISLLSGVRETLAGRVVSRELYPFTVAEIAGISKPMVLQLLSCSSRDDVAGVLSSAALRYLKPEAAKARQALGHLVAWGGMPSVLNLDEDKQRWIWLEEYCQTYLQRDVADLGRVADLESFFRFQRIAARRTAGLVNFSDLARDADFSFVTAKKYLRYLELSYHSFLLPAKRKLRRARPIKAPRLHWIDLGVQRVLSGLRVGLTGQQFESLIVAEFYKVARTFRLAVELKHLRTRDGREVDLLIRLPGGGWLAVEIKASERAAVQDARHLRGMEEILGEPVLAGLVIYRGDTFRHWDNGLFAVPAASLFAPLENS